MLAPRSPPLHRARCDAMTASLADLETPVVTVDLDTVEANLRRFQDYADRHDLAVRPHIKTHKIPRFARMQVELGAVGITCQKLGEAEIMADAGIEDILLPYNLLGPAKVARAVALARRCRLGVSVDHAEVAHGLSEGMAAAGLTLPVLVECDTGAQRCGVQSPSAAVHLAREVEGLPGLRFTGLMTYPPKGVPAAVDAWLAEARGLLEATGLPAEVVSNGGTPDMWRAHKVSAASEHRPGTYIYNDRSLVAYGTCGLDDCALRVVATVVSAPTPDRVILDAGSKTLTSDLLGLTGHGLILEYPDAVIYGLSEEHGHVDVGACTGGARPRLGERVTVIPNHACVVSNLFDAVYAVQDNRVIEPLRIAARGRVQ